MPQFELEPDEKIIRYARKHWFLFAMELVPYAIIALIPLSLPFLLELSPTFAPYAGYASLSHPLMRVALGIWLLVVWTGAWSAFTRYFLNAWVLTDRRIVDIKQHSYFNREVSSLLLNRVQDVTTDVVGLLTSLLDIGTIVVQSAGTVDEFRMSGIPEPEKMRDAIMERLPRRQPLQGAPAATQGAPTTPQAQ